LWFLNKLLVGDLREWVFLSKKRIIAHNPVL
jgi:hypothetical protein